VTGRDVLSEAEQANPTLNKFDVHFPHALALATECITDRYDAIIVDEAQDFGEEYWLPVELLLRDETESALFLFYDHNQAVYKRVSSFPIRDEPFLLTRNCRNTVHIHQAAYRYYRGERTEPPTIAGEEVLVIDAPSRGSQAKRLHAHLIGLVDHEKVRPEDIAVLVPSVEHQAYYRALSDRPLPAGCKWAFEEYGVAGGVRVDTVHRFKGLEATVVYLWGADTFSPELDTETLYVTLSRAKSRLILVGDEVRCRSVLDSQTA
jgi:superfamily I DNA/RNA helicase